LVIPDNPALAALWRVLDRTAARTGHAELRRELLALRDGLAEPLRLAVVGGVSAGKSSLVNAILRVPAAPVGEGETTLLTSWLTYGADHGRVVVEGVGGEHVTRLRPDGFLPADLGMGTDEVERIRIELDLPVLRRLTLIDTPGSNTTTAEVEERAQRALRRDAQAVLYVSSELSTQDQKELQTFRDLCAGGEFGASNAMLVLSKVDDSASLDPWPSARKRVVRRMEQIRGLAFAAVAVAGAVAMTARARLLGDDDLVLLRELAGLDELELEAELMTLTIDLDRATGRQARLAELNRRLRMYGMVAAARFLGEHPDAGLDEVHAELERCSGFDAPAAAPGQVGGVAEAIEVFARRAEQLTARAAIHRMHDLQTIPYLPEADRRLLLEQLARLDDDADIQDQLRDLRVTLALDAVGRGQVRLGDKRYAELVRLATGDGPAARLGLPAGATAQEVGRCAMELSGAWRALANLTRRSGAGRHVEHVLDVIEELARSPAGARPPVPYAGLDELLAVRSVPGSLRAAAWALNDGTCLGAQVGLDAAAGGPAVAGRAAELLNAFRSLARRPLRPADREAVEACTDAFEGIWHAATAPG
jgi:hypothetical protein